jgi:hypothetical protein
MRKGSFVVAAWLVMFVTTFGAKSSAWATYGRAHIWIPEKKGSLWGEKFTCEKEVKPQYIAQLKSRNPEIDEEKLAQEILIQADEEKGAIVLTVPGEDEKSALENARLVGGIAVGMLRDMARSGQRFALEAIENERDGVMREITELEEKLAGLQRDKGMFDPKKEMDSLVSRLNSYREELVGAELKSAELEAKLSFLSRKAAEVRDAVSAEEIAALENTAESLSSSLEEIRESRMRKLAIVLEQKEKGYEHVQKLREAATVSQKEVEDAEAELRLARSDYEAAASEYRRVEERLKSVRENLAKARERRAAMGVQELMPVIAQGMLECESEAAAVEVKKRHLRNAIAVLEAEIAEKGSIAAELERRQAKVDGLKKRLAGLFDSEGAIRAQMWGGMPPQVVMTEALERLPERPAKYNVIGEVRNPGLYELQVRSTILTAMAMAGGFTDYADQGGVIVLRRAGDQTERSNIDVGAILKGKAPDDFFIEADDVIWVPRKGSLGL